MNTVRRERPRIDREVVMRKIDKSKPVLVTGGTGYMASWIIKMLLEEGMTVHATVRGIDDVRWWSIDDPAAT